MSNGIKDLNPDRPLSLKDMEYLEDWTVRVLGRKKDDLYEGLKHLGVEQVYERPQNPLMSWSPSYKETVDRIKKEKPPLTEGMKQYIRSLDTKKAWLGLGRPKQMVGTPWRKLGIVGLLLDQLMNPQSLAAGTVEDYFGDTDGLSEKEMMQYYDALLGRDN
jgi:hypothetical protein